MPWLFFYWLGRISVEIYGIARHNTKILGCLQTGIELVPEVRREGKGAHNLTAAEKGMTMHTTITTKKPARIGSASWLEISYAPDGARRRRGTRARISSMCLSC